MSDLPEIVKQHFVELAKRRKALGIKLGQFKIMIDSAALESVSELWESWVRALGKRAAEDNLVEAMVNQHELIRARLQYKINEGQIPRRREVPRGAAVQQAPGCDQPVPPEAES